MAYSPILPSSLLEQADNPQYSYVSKLLGNNSLRVGVVIGVHETADKTNINKMSPEYDVMVVQQEADGGINASTYKNCLTADFFGGVADFFEAKHFAPDKKTNVSKSGTLTKDNNGSIVLLLCLDGIAEKGIIIGSLKHPSRKTTLTKEAGKHSEGEFNGVNWQINKDGELKVTFKSNTNKDGKPQDTKAGGSYIKMDKTGSLELNDGNKESIKIDKTNKTVDINAAKDISITTSNDANITASNNININAKKDLIIAAQGKAGITISQDINFEIKKAFKLTAQSLDIDSKNIVKLKTGTMTVKADSIQIEGSQLQYQGTQVQINANQIMLGQGAMPALTMSSQFLGVGNLGAPVLSTAISGFSTKVFIAN